MAATLRAAPPPTDDLRDGGFRLEVTDTNLARVLAALATAAGWSPCANPAAEAPVVTDSWVAPGRRAVLVVAPTPWATATALRSVFEGAASAVVCTDTPDALPDALDAVAAGNVTVPSRVVELAREMPELTARQVAVLRSVIRGRSNTEMARELYVSPASVKRELAELFRRCDVANRAALAAHGVTLGVHQSAPCAPAR